MTTILTVAVIIIIFIILYKVFKFLMSLLLIVVFLMIAYATNPGHEQHKAAVIKKAKESSLTLKGKKIEREDYYIFSLTSIIQGEDHRIIGAGGFTQIILFGKP